MERLPGGAAAARRGPVRAQAPDHQFVEQIVEIIRIEGAARRLLRGRAGALIALLLEHRLRLGDGHALRVHLDGGEVAAIAQQCIEQLADMGLGRAPEAGLPHHLLAIMGPALGEAGEDEQPLGEQRRAVRGEELDEMAGHRLVHRREQQALLVDAGIGRDVIDGGDAGFVGAGRIDIGRVPAIIGRADRGRSPARCRGW